MKSVTKTTFPPAALGKKETLPSLQIHFRQEFCSRPSCISVYRYWPLSLLIYFQMYASVTQQAELRSFTGCLQRILPV